MSLKNDGSQLYDYNGNMVTPSVTLFKQSKRRLDEKRKALEDMQNEYDLLEQQAFNLYKSHVNYCQLDTGFIKKTKDWLHMKKSGKDMDGNKLDGRKHYEEKEIANYFINRIQEYLGINDIEIITIMTYNFGEAEEIVFMSHGHKWMLDIPTLNGVRYKSFQEYGGSCFKLKISHYDSEHYTASVGSTFIEEELKDIMQEGIDKYCVHM